jgi:hypothetical protein
MLAALDSNPRAPGTAAHSVRNLLFLAVLIGSVYLLLVRELDFLVDDAYINFRYARNLTRGDGLRFNLSESPPIEAYDLLWTLVMAIPELFHWNTPELSKLVTIACGATLLFAIARTVHRRFGANLWITGAAGMFVATLPVFAAWSTSGMETMPAALLIFLVYERLLGDPERPHGWQAGIFAAAAVLMRPDGVVVAGTVLFAAGSSAWWFQRPKLRAAVLRALLLFAICWLLHTRWRLWYHGEWISNPVRIKGDLSWLSFERGFEYVATMLLAFPGLLLAAVPIFFALMRGERRECVPLAMICATLVAYVIAVGGDWMPMGRFLVVVVPFFALLFAHGLEALWRRGMQRAWTSTATALCIGLSLPAAFEQDIVPLTLRERVNCRWGLAYAPERSHLDYANRMVDRCDREGRAAAQFTHRGETLIRGGIGAFGYRTDVDILDIFGLVDREVARLSTPKGRRDLAGHTKMVDPAFFFPRRPTYLQSVLAEGPQEEDLELTLRLASLRFGLVEREERHRLGTTGGSGTMQVLILTRLLPLTDELERLRPVLQAAKGYEQSVPEGIESELERRMPAASESIDRIRVWIQGMSAGTCEPLADGAVPNGAPRELPELRWRVQVWSRVDSRPWHNAPRGAIALAIPLSGQPTLNGRPAGWEATPPGSTAPWHIDGGTIAMITLRPAD